MAICSEQRCLQVKSQNGGLPVQESEGECEGQSGDGKVVSAPVWARRRGGFCRPQTRGLCKRVLEGRFKLTLRVHTFYIWALWRLAKQDLKWPREYILINVRNIHRVQRGQSDGHRLGFL